MESSGVQKYPWYDYEKDARGKKYYKSIIRTMKLTGYLMFVYPPFALIGIIFVLRNLPGIAILLFIYWAPFYFLLRSRFKKDRAFKGLSITFLKYATKSPVGITYWKSAAFTMFAIFVMYLFASLSLQWYEGVIFIVVALAVVYFILFRFSWIGVFASNSVELESPEIIASVKDIESEAGLPEVNFRVMKASEFKIANAFCYGIFTPVVYITDYLLENISRNEAIAVLSHELGHVKYRDTLKKGVPPMVCFSIAGIITTVVGLAFANYIPFPPLRTLFAPIYAAVIIILFAGVFIPALASSRREFRVDRFAAKYSDAPDFISALAKITFLNYAPLSGISRTRRGLIARINRIEKYSKE